MLRLLMSAVAVLGALAVPAPAAEISGKYVEVRTCDVWTGPCFANAEGNLTGKNAIMAWHIDTGTFAGVKLDGLNVIAVVEASETLGAKQYGPASAVFVVDATATPEQRDALVKLAQLQAGDLLDNVIDVRQSTISTFCCGCAGEGCSEIVTDGISIKTRCLDEAHDKACGNETAYYPPLVAGAQCVVGVAEHSYRGDGLAASWQESERRGAYVGTFTIR